MGNWMKAAWLALLACLALPAQAAPISDPEAAMRAFYTALEKETPAPAIPWSARMEALFALDLKEAQAAGDEIGRVDFDYFINGQDGQIAKSVVTAHAVDGAPGRRIVVVRFENFDMPQENHFYWQRDAAGAWTLDDVRSFGEDGGFVLSHLLQYGADPAEKTRAAARVP